jgi:protein-L-isoaspartate(D-aspartate) O-methyltransferase
VQGQPDRRQPSRTGARLVHALRDAGIRDQRLLAAFECVPRELFVPAGAEPGAATDQPIPIGLGQVTTQPSLIAQMIEALQLRPSDRVLEIGTGYGYQTAILAELATEVHSIERFEDLARMGSANLAEAGCGAVEITVGDGTLGHPDYAPYDAIVVAAAAPAVPQPLIEQLADGGRLVMPIGPGGDDEVIAFRKDQGELKLEKRVCYAFFVPLVGRHGQHRP